jgi:methyltransferase (TIGR00027 family)
VSARTANWIAAARARESTRPDRLFHDPWAAQLAGPQPLEQPDNPFLPVRTRFFDDLIEETTTWAAQVVLLGAGFDTRAYRLGLPAERTVFELDRAEVFASKEGVLATAEPRCLRRTVAVDLAGDWTSPLLESGFDPDRPTVWLAEGVLFYLTAGAVEALLAGAAALARDRAVFAADTFGTGLLGLDSMQPLIRARNAAGQPLPYCTDDPRGLLLRCGWDVEAIVEPGQPRANFGRLRPVPENWSSGGTYLMIGLRKATGGE